jgi:predicted dehydrogenase
MPSVCRWGILGAANIARKNWTAIRYSGNGTVAAVASRDAAKAQRFIDDCKAHVPMDPVAVAGYAELLKRDDIDAVYIPLPTGVRREWVERAAAAGKHVLCEKPCGSTAADLRAMLDACKKHNVQFMDGVMFMHGQRLPMMRDVLDDGKSVGAIRRITSQFTFHGDDAFGAQNIRANEAMEPLGCLGDLGWYDIRFSLWAMKYQMPATVTGRILSAYGDGPAAVPREFAGDLYFADGVTASFYCSFRTALQQWAEVSGDKGCLRVPDFVVPYHGAETAFEVRQDTVRQEDSRYRTASHAKRYAAVEYGDGAANAPEANMVRTFADLALGGKPDSFWGEVALKTQLVADACLRSARDGGTPVAVG